MKKHRMRLWMIALRLFGKAAPAKGLLTISTLSSILNKLCHISLMASGALMVLCSFGQASGSLRWYGACMLLSAVGIFVFRYLEGYISHAAAYMLLADMREKMYRHLRRLAPACLVDRRKGDILSVAIGDIETIEHFFAHTIGPIFVVIVLPLLTLIAALFIHPVFALILLPVYLLNVVVLPLFSLHAGRILGQEYRVSLGELKTLTLESVTGIRDIQIFRYEQQQEQRIVDKTREMSAIAHRMILFQQAVTSIPGFFIYIARMLYVMAASSIAGLSPAQTTTVIVFSFVVTSSFSSTQSLLGVAFSLIQTFAAAERIFAIEDGQPEIVEKPDAVPLEKVQEISFQDVSFSYEASSPLLKHINLELHARDRIGIIGESGAGKSTLLRLLMRFWNPSQGDILINGRSVSDYQLESLHRRIGVLEQDTFLFNDTIAANIAIGKSDATAEEIAQAARRAGIAELIESLPEGYETQMGEMGDRLSGGEKQRIGIARLLIADTDVIVMDEPTSNLDVLNEEGILKTLRETCADKILIIVSHRLSTLTDCTQIYQIEDGCLIVPVHDRLAANRNGAPVN